MDTTTRITYLDKELIASQAFHVLGVGTTTLTVTYGQERIVIDFIVSEVADQEANKMWGQVVSSDRLQIHLVNFRQLLPSQVLGPSDLGTMAGRPVTIIVELTGVADVPESGGASSSGVVGAPHTSTFGDPISRGSS